MAQPTATHATNDMVGIREDLSNVIYDISPIETPFLSSVEHTEATNVLHEWQTHDLASAANNAAIEGDDRPGTAATATTRLNNRTQISTKDATVSGTARAVNTAGRGDEMDFQILNRGRELRRDMETGLLSNKAKVTGTDVLAGQYGGIVSYIKTNQSVGATGAAPTGDGSDTRTDGTQRAFTETLLKAVLKSCWDNGGSPDTIMVGSFNKQAASGFSDRATVEQKAEDDVLHTAFNVLESDFGQLRIVPNRFQRARDALVLDLSMWKVPFLSGRNMVTFDLAKTGDTEKKQILSEYTLEACQEKSSGIVADLTTA